MSTRTAKSAAANKSGEAPKVQKQVTLRFDKHPTKGETPGTFRFEEKVGKDADALVRSLYLRKDGATIFGDASQIEGVKVTIEPIMAS